MSEADSTGALTVKGGHLRPLQLRLGELVRTMAETESTRLTIWSPLLLVIGIWTYFALPNEPVWTLVLAALAFALAVFALARNRKLLLALALVAFGFSLANIRSHWVATPVLRAFAPEAQVSGFVSDIERRGPKRHQLVVDVSAISGIPAGEIPRRVQLQLDVSGTAPQIGDHITGKALLAPLPLPAAPGAFDYGRDLYFRSIGATGRFTGGIATASESVPWRYRQARAFHRLRRAIGERIHAVIEGPLGSFAEALITGERAAIPRGMNDSLRTSGLFHVLSISGLHMALTTGAVFWTVRAVLALFPGLTLRWPIKKWAAAAALVVGLFYMLLADSGAATERSFIMVAIALFAVIVDRPAISLHNLAVAAMIILVFQPEQAVSAGFQMSFLAVMGLAAFFEWWNARSETEVRQAPSWIWRVTRNGLLLVCASLLTSLIAGGLSGIPAAHHFGRIAPFGIAANALALPVVGFVVMPCALAAVILMPFGLEYWPLLLMEQGLRLFMSISDWVASWPSADLSLPLLNAKAAVLLALAAACIAMGKSMIRWLALPLIMLAGLSLLAQRAPALLVEERGRAVAARSLDDNIVPAIADRRASFAVRRWLQANGQNESASAAAKRALWSCTASQCSTEIAGRSVVFLKETAEPVKPCPPASIIIAQYPLRRQCRGKDLTIDRFDVWRNGAYAVEISPDSIAVTTARGIQGRRPWTYQPRARAKR